MARTATRRPVAPAPPSQSISSYTRVSKSQVPPDAKAAAALKKNASLAVKEAPTISRKRKAAAAAAAAAAVDDAGDDGLQIESKSALAPGEEVRTPVKRSRRESVKSPALVKTSRSKESKQDEEDKENNQQNQEGKATNSTPRKGNQPPSSVKKTPTRSTPAKSTPTKTRSTTHQSKLEKYNYTSRKADNGADLVRLHRAFLKTILLHIAHSGRNAPIDIASISPNISRNWGKRAVTVEDIRRCVAIESSAAGGNAEEEEEVSSPFLVSDYGRGKVCVEVKEEWVRGNLTIYEERLCRRVEENIRRICVARARDETCDMKLPLEDLPLSDLPQAEIVNKDGGIQANPLLAKGHRALTELKNELSSKQQEKESKKHAPADADADATLNPNGTKMSLLDRIRHKQLAKANGPLPPSGPALERRAALNRVADVAATISVFSLSNTSPAQRQAFTMTLVLDKLRDSLRVPISRDEGKACVRLIASEVAPEWVKVVMVGGRENVVIQRDAQPVDRVLSHRVQKLLESGI